MPKPSPLWGHFHKLDRLYKNSTTHPAAKCNTCVEHQKYQLEQKNLEDHAAGHVARIMNDTELTVQGEWILHEISSEL